MNANAQEKTPGYNQKIPEKIMTPNKVETHFGTLDFVDGVPTAETTRKLYDNLDYIRGVEVFLHFIPACSMSLAKPKPPSECFLEKRLLRPRFRRYGHRPAGNRIPF